ncbi:MAG: hypothetical protein K2Q45_00495 [Nitrosomonas sp.]|nr:hypothetical protein [Nitrosomonas sp.]
MQSVTITLPLNGAKVTISKEQIEWFDIRDIYFGLNCMFPCKTEALALATKCAYPDAQWLCKEHERLKADVNNTHLFMGNDAGEARTMTFRAMSSRPVDEELLSKAAAMGYVFAQYYSVCMKYLKFVSAVMPDVSIFEQCALQGEREAIQILGALYMYGSHGVKKNRDLSRQYYFCAAQLGHLPAMESYARELTLNNPEKWYWIGLVAKKTQQFDGDFAVVVLSFKNDPSLIAAVFMIGKMMKMEYVEKESIQKIYKASEAMDFFKKQCLCPRRAVDAWSLVALRIGNHMINKDMRRKIGMLVWNARDTVYYE